MQELADSIGAFLMSAFLTAVLVAGFLALPLYWLSKNARRLCRSRAFPVFAAFAAVAIIYGGSKPPGANRYLTATWDEYFTAPMSAQADTNDSRIASFKWNHAAFLPGTANAVFYAANRFDDIPSLAEIGRCPITNRAFTVQMPEDATNYLYSALCDWTPPQPVVTNGVYHLRAVKSDEKIIPLGVAELKTDCPYDAEVEYLESTGTQWIDTGKILSSTGFAYDADVMFKTTDNCQVFGGRTQANSGTLDSLVLFVVGAAWRFDYFGNSRPGSAIKANTRYSVSLANGKTTVNGVELSTPITAGHRSGATVYIFAGHRPQAPGDVEFLSSIRLYSLKFYQGGVLTADYQPVRIGTTGYLYDRVSGMLFGNSGTGAFICGPDKK